MYCVEEYTKPSDISFRYVLSTDDKKILSDIIYSVLSKFTKPSQTIPFVENSIRQIQHIYDAFDKFFTENPGNYFIRLSTLSPKDAWYQLMCDTPSIEDVNDIDDELTIDDIQRELSVLKVSNAKQALMVLCHSDRVRVDLEFREHEIAILLLPWKDDILHDTETRCFIRNKKLIAFSQYYADLKPGYQSISHKNVLPNTFYNVVCQYIEDQIHCDKIPYTDSVIDIALSANCLNSPELSSEDVIFIEINAFDGDTDDCLFKWDEILEIHSSSPIFKYNNHNECVSYIL